MYQPTHIHGVSVFVVFTVMPASRHSAQFFPSGHHLQLQVILHLLIVRLFYRCWSTKGREVRSFAFPFRGVARFSDRCGRCEGCVCGKGHTLERFGKYVVDGAEIRTRARTARSSSAPSNRPWSLPLAVTRWLFFPNTLSNRVV